MADVRLKRAKLNIAVTLGCQLVTLFCGLVVPRLLLGAFGSEAYGATASITQFLAYITLLEGGIGGVARAALYKPLAENDMAAISRIVLELKRFFSVVAVIFLGYVAVLAFAFPAISGITCFDTATTFLLVAVISLSTFAQYFIGITNAVLLQAAQRSYITNLINILGTVLNAVLVAVLVALGQNMIVVKLASSCAFTLRPVLMWLYVRRNYRLEQVPPKSEKLLKQKWEGLGQHIAFFLHNNTDIAVLTVLGNLKLVAVYSVYNMVVAQMQTFISSFATGMEALFGDMLAKKEYDLLDKTFSRYETLICGVSLVLLGTTAVLILPFVLLYTKGITDAEYTQPFFAMVMILSSLTYCLRQPYHSVVIAAGHFRQTRWAAYGEVIVNVGLSLLLVNRVGLAGVAIGTLAATAARLGYYVWYLSKNLICRKVGRFLRRGAVELTAFTAIVLVGSRMIGMVQIGDYFRWALCGMPVALMAAAVTVVIHWVFYRDDLRGILKK